ncbi:hypothetical protein [Kitasatospora sp. NPDC054795]
MALPLAQQLFPLPSEAEHRPAAAFDSVVRIDPAREPAMSLEAHAA